MRAIGHYKKFDGFNHQGSEPDCMLNTMATLAGVSIDFARGFYLAKRGETWTQMVNHHGWKFAEEVKMVCEEFGIEWLFKQMDFDRATGIRPHSDKADAPDLSGEGAFTTARVNRQGRVVGRHIVAFKNGLIYDSNFHEPMTWSQWWAIKKMGANKMVIEQVARLNGATGVVTIENYRLVANNAHGEKLYQIEKGRRGPKYVVVTVDGNKISAVRNDKGRLRPTKPTKGIWQWINRKDAR